MKADEVIERISRYLDEKLKIDSVSCYFITKKLNEQYWETIRDAEEIENGSTEDFSDFEPQAQQALQQHPTMDNTIRQQQENPQLPNVKGPDVSIRVI
jgi:hypothetical protein